MDYRTRLAVATLLVAAAPSYAAFDPTCSEDERTNELFCFQQSELREAGGVRTAPLYTGGPKGVSKTTFTVAANCATGVLHIKDHRGVSFAGSGPGEGTIHSRRLRRLVCEASLPTAKKKRG